MHGYNIQASAEANVKLSKLHTSDLLSGPQTSLLPTPSVIQQPAALPVGLAYSIRSDEKGGENLLLKHDIVPSPLWFQRLSVIMSISPTCLDVITFTVPCNWHS